MTIEKKSLFVLMQDRISIQQIIEQLSGELTEETEKALDLNQHELNAKAEGYIMVLEELRAYVELNERYVSKATDNIARAECAINRLRRNLLNATKTFGKIQAGIHVITTRKSHSVEITDPAKIPAEYQTTKIVTTPDKNSIADSLKAGVEVPGCTLRENIHLKIA